MSTGVDIATLGLEIDASQAIRNTRELSGSLQSLGDTGDRTEKRLRTLGTRVAGILSVGVAMRTVMRNTIEAQAAQAQLDAAVRDTGGAAQRSVAQLNAMAAAMQRTTSFSDEAVKSAQALLLSFQNIRGDTFDRATQAAADLATRMRTDLSSAAQQLGKALENPAEGLSLLRRSGVTFSESQAAVIKRLQETGDVAKAQDAILAAIEQRFGSAAEAARDTLGGALTGLSNDFGELFEVTREKSGGVVDAINALSGVVRTVAEHMRTVVTVTLAAAGAWAAYNLTVRAAAIWNGIVAAAQTVRAFVQLALGIRQAANAAALLAIASRTAAGALAGILTFAAGFAVWKKIIGDMNTEMEKFNQQLSNVGTTSGGPPIDEATLELIKRTRAANADLVREAQQRYELAQREAVAQRLLAIEHDATNKVIASRRDLTGDLLKESLAAIEAEKQWNIAAVHAEESLRRQNELIDAQREKMQNLMRTLQSTFSDIFTRLLSDTRGVFSTIKDIVLRTAAEILASQAVKQLAGMFGGVGGAAKPATGGQTSTPRGTDLPARVDYELAQIVVAARKSILSQLVKGLAVGAGAFSVAYGKGPVAGTALGAATGAALGSVVPGVGTAAGAAVGVLGGLAGGLLGMSNAAKEAAARMREFRDSLRNISQSIAEFADNAVGYGELGQQFRGIQREANTLGRSLRDSMRASGLTPILSLSGPRFSSPPASSVSMLEQEKYIQQQIDAARFQASHRGNSRAERAGFSALADEWQAMLEAFRDNVARLKKSFIEDLDLRELSALAASETDARKAAEIRRQAEELQLRRKHAQELADAELVGFSAVEKERLQYVQGLEREALAAREAAEAAERMRAFTSSMREITESIREFREQARGPASDIGQRHSSIFDTADQIFSRIGESLRGMGVEAIPEFTKITSLADLDSVIRTLEQGEQLSGALSALGSDVARAALEGLGGLRELRTALAENIAAMQQSFTDDLGLRSLRAQSVTAGTQQERDALREQADLLELRRRQERELADAAKAGMDETTIALLKRVHAEEAAAVAAKETTEAIRDATSALNAPSGLRLSLFRWRATAESAAEEMAAMFGTQLSRDTAVPPPAQPAPTSTDFVYPASPFVDSRSASTAAAAGYDTSTAMLDVTRTMAEDIAAIRNRLTTLAPTAVNSEPFSSTSSTGIADSLANASAMRHQMSDLTRAVGFDVTESARVSSMKLAETLRSASRDLAMQWWYAPHAPQARADIPRSQGGVEHITINVQANAVGGIQVHQQTGEDGNALATRVASVAGSELASAIVESLERRRLRGGRIRMPFSDTL